MVPDASIALAALTLTAFNAGGRPPMRPRARLAANPVRVRSRRSSTSNCPRAAKMWRISRPVALVVSMFSCGDRRPTPRAVKVSSWSEAGAGTRQTVGLPFGRSWEAGLCSAIHVRQPTRGIGPVGEVVTCRHCCGMTTIRIGSKPRRRRPGSAASPASRLVRRSPGSSPSHQAIPSCEISANALPSPPAGPMKHTARHRLLRGQPTPGDHRYRDRRSQPPSGARCA